MNFRKFKRYCESLVVQDIKMKKHDDKVKEYKKAEEDEGLNDDCSYISWLNARTGSD